MAMGSLLVAAAWALSSAAAAAAQNMQTTWAAVVMAFHGEREALLSTDFPFITPLGTWQAHDAGSVIRTRYIQGPGNTITGSYPISGISAETIDNGQLFIVAAATDYVAASAQAFMQGVYPPFQAVNADADSMLANGSMIQFPLDGYQYPTIGLISPLDFNYIWLSGNDDCPEYQSSIFDYFGSVEYYELYGSTLSFYQDLLPFFQDVLDSEEVNFFNAYALYDYASFQYMHNSSVAKLVSQSSIAELRDLASSQQFSLNGDLEVSGLVSGDEIRAVAGKTFASKVLDMLQQNALPGNGNNIVLSLFFSGLQPFLSFFSISGLSNLQPKFQSLPEPGSVMVFELFSDSPNLTSLPSADQLWVRFLFRNGTSSTEPLISYPLFGRGNSEIDMTWTDFQNGMANIMTPDVESWCKTCSSKAIYCPVLSNNQSNGTSCSPANSSNSSNSSNSLDNSKPDAASYSKISPATAGIIGAVVAIAAIALLILASALCCGVRLCRKRQSTLGGFKGAGKHSSDADLTHAVAKDGAEATVVKHERIGSWEMADAKKGNTKDSRHGSVDDVVSRADYSQKDGDDDISIINPFGDPVKVDDRV